MKIYYIFLALIIGMVIGLCYPQKKFNYSEKRLEGFLTSPLLECNGDESNIEELSISKYSLNNLVDELKNKGSFNHVSVYVRDLNNGPWIGINEKEEFIGASLLKVPVMIATLQKGNLDDKLEYKNRLDFTEQYFGNEEIIVGEVYTKEELVEKMIIQSDNNAAVLLMSQLKNQDIYNVFTSIGLGSPLEVKDYQVNTKTYSGMFRVLFNASYLSKEDSEKALDILTRSEFKKGIVKYLPKEIKVAHKFGVREVGELKQLHDCGIVYYPKHPYLVCIMTKGDDLEKMAEGVANISLYIYKEVNKIEI